MLTKQRSDENVSSQRRQESKFKLVDSVFPESNDQQSEEEEELMALESFK